MERFTCMERDGKHWIQTWRRLYEHNGEFNDDENAPHSQTPITST